MYVYGIIKILLIKIIIVLTNFHYIIHILIVYY